MPFGRLLVLGRFIRSRRAVNQEAFSKAVPRRQDFDSEDYDGSFHFHLWWQNRRMLIEIDDKLRFFKRTHSSYELLYFKSNDGNEFWPALMEKSVAKSGSWSGPTTVCRGTRSTTMRNGVDGEFWRKLNDFCDQFSIVFIYKLHG